MKPNIRQQQGVVLVMVILMLLIMMLLAVSVAASSSSYTVSVNNALLKKQAFQAAESAADILLERMNRNSATINTIRSTLCTRDYPNQVTAETAGSENFGSNSKDVRKLNVTWYACAPVRGATATPVGNSKSCNAGTGYTCFSLVITGIACPTGINNPSDASCVVSRHLQGYMY